MLRWQCYVNKLNIWDQSNGLAKRDDAQHPCVKEVSKAMAQVQSDCYPKTRQRLISA